MADEETRDETVDTDTIWQRLGVTDPDEEFVEEEEAAEEEAVKEDKLDKKLSSRVDNLEKKFRQERLAQAKEKFLESADPLEKDLFKAISGDVKDPEALDHAIELVKARAEKMKETEAAAKEQLERSWGVANPGHAAKPSEDEEKRLAERIASGDTKAGFAALIGDDPMLQGRI
jgi:cysteinyl-tRNA synthetase